MLLKSLGSGLVSVMLGLSGCGSQGCTNRSVASRVSPDGLHSVVLFQRDCGPGAGLSTQLWTGAAAQSQVEGQGNVLVAESQIRRRAIGLLPPVVDFWWHGNNELHVILLQQARLTLQEHTVGGVAIDYEVRSSEKP